MSVFALIFVCLAASVASFKLLPITTSTRKTSLLKETCKVVLYASSTGDDKSLIREFDMTLDELKAELDLRKVDYEDCVSKAELVNRLVESRTLGKADPTLLQRFNEEDKEYSADDVSRSLESEVMDEVVARDGALPGGLSPEIMKALSSNPEIMRMLRDPKMQDIMSVVMQGGPDAMKKYLSDPDAMSLLQKLSYVMSKIIK